LLLIAIAGIYVLGASGVGAERLRIEAEAALRRAVGPDVTASIGPTGITLDGARLLALRVKDFKVDAKGQPQIEAGSLRFGLRLLPLLGGRLELGTAKISDARIHVSAFVLEKRDWTLRLRNEDGLIDPDLVGNALFEALHGALDLLRRGR